jgi:hypothetical protein
MTRPHTQQRRCRWTPPTTPPQVSPYVVAAPLWLVVANTADSGFVSAMAGAAAIACSLADAVPLVESVIVARRSRR